MVRATASVARVPEATPRPGVSPTDQRVRASRGTLVRRPSQIGLGNVEAESISLGAATVTPAATAVARTVTTSGGDVT